MEFSESTSAADVEAVVDQSLQAWEDAEELLETAISLADSAQILLELDADEDGYGDEDEEGGELSPAENNDTSGPAAPMDTPNPEAAAPMDTSNPEVAGPSIDPSAWPEVFLARPASFGSSTGSLAGPPAGSIGVPTGRDAGPFPAADPQVDPKAWAEEFTKRYDAISGRKRIQTLAAQMNMDAKDVYAQLQLAQEIIYSGAMKDAAFWNKMTNAAMATKAAAKVGLFVTATVATAGGSLTALSTGSATLTQAGGILASGFDVMAEIGATASAIVLGENHKVTVSMNDIQDVTGPIAMGVGVAFPDLGSADSALAGAITTLGNLAMDYFSEGRIAGWNVKKMAGSPKTTTETPASEPAKKPSEVTPSETVPPLAAGETEITMASVPVGEDVEETNKNLESVGFPPLPLEEPTTTLEEAAAEVEVDMEAAKARMEELQIQMTSALAQIEEALVVAALADVPGQYQVSEVAYMDGEEYASYQFVADVSLQGTAMTVTFEPDRPVVLTGTFDLETGVFVGTDLNRPPDPGPDASPEEQFVQIYKYTEYMLTETTINFDLSAYPLTATGGYVYEADHFGLTWVATTELTFTKTSN